MHAMYWLLESMPLLQSLPEQIRPLVIEQFVPVSFMPGQFLTWEVAEQALYVLVSGQAQIVKQTAAGQELVLRVLQAGDRIGDTFFFEESSHIAAVRAESHVEALKLSRDAFMRLIHHTPDIRACIALESRRRRLETFFASTRHFHICQPRPWTHCFRNSIPCPCPTTRW